MHTFTLANEDRRGDDSDAEHLKGQLNIVQRVIPLVFRYSKNGQFYIAYPIEAIGNFVCERIGVVCDCFPAFLFKYVNADAIFLGRRSLFGSEQI